MKSSLVVPVRPYCLPGAISASPDSPPLSTASPSSEDRLKPYLPMTQAVMTNAPVMSMAALTICTQVVPFMPPTRT